MIEDALVIVKSDLAAGGDNVVRSFRVLEALEIYMQGAAWTTGAAHGSPLGAVCLLPNFLDAHARYPMQTGHVMPARHTPTTVRAARLNRAGAGHAPSC